MLIFKILFVRHDVSEINLCFVAETLDEIIEEGKNGKQKDRKSIKEDIFDSYHDEKPDEMKCRLR